MLHRHQHRVLQQTPSLLSQRLSVRQACCHQQPRSPLNSRQQHCQTLLTHSSPLLSHLQLRRSQAQIYQILIHLTFLEVHSQLNPSSLRGQHIQIYFRALAMFRVRTHAMLSSHDHSTAWCTAMMYSSAQQGRQLP